MARSDCAASSVLAANKPRGHKRPRTHQAFNRGLPFGSVGFFLWKPGRVGRCIEQSYQLAAIGQPDPIIETAGTSPVSAVTPLGPRDLRKSLASRRVRADGSSQ
jgi:hypothetical protein